GVEEDGLGLGGDGEVRRGCCSDESLEKEHIMKKYEEVTARLKQDLEGICFEKLDILDEVKEQVALILAQFKRAKGKNRCTRSLS
ncbi:hypothetical protein Tco_0118131, partial [Tanacetum coccineum]